MSFEFRDAKLTAGQLFIGLSGPSWSGKTYSALRLATGIANGGKIVGIDTENGRMLHYASKFQFGHALLDPPFSPQRYGEVIKAAAALNPAVIIVDSLTHEHTGEGGVLDMHDAEIASGKKDPAAWVAPKRARKRLLMDILRLKCHIIVCMRAEDQTEWVKDDKGKLTPVPRRTLSGHVGWIPVVGKEWPYEFTVSLLLTPDALGVPKPVKLYEELAPFVSLNQPLSEETGKRLREWAAGASSPSPAIPPPGLTVAQLVANAKAADIPDAAVSAAIARVTGREGALARECSGVQLAAVWADISAAEVAAVEA